MSTTENDNNDIISLNLHFCNSRQNRNVIFVIEVSKNDYVSAIVYPPLSPNNFLYRYIRKFILYQFLRQHFLFILLKVTCNGAMPDLP